MVVVGAPSRNDDDGVAVAVVVVDARVRVTNPSRRSDRHVPD